MPTKVLHCNSKGKRNGGRQTKMWIDNIKEDLKVRKQREVEMDCTTSLSANLMGEKQDEKQE